MKRSRRVLAGAVAVALLGSGWALLDGWVGAGPLPDGHTVIVPDGANLNTVSIRLQKMGAIYSARAFRFHARLFGAGAKIKAGEFNIQQLDVQTYFFRRTNMNALGQPRSWTDHLLWHHAAHTVDLFAYQCGSPVVKANAVQGPIHPTLGISMDMSIQLKAANGAICTLSLSFNNDGPLGTWFRYIGDTGTYLAKYDDLYNGKEEQIDVSKVAVSLNGIELQDREFFGAIREGREPISSVSNVLACYQVLHDCEVQMGH